MDKWWKWAIAGTAGLAVVAGVTWLAWDMTEARRENPRDALEEYQEDLQQLQEQE